MTCIECLKDSKYCYKQVLFLLFNIVTKYGKNKSFYLFSGERSFNVTGTVTTHLCFFLNITYFFFITTYIQIRVLYILNNSRTSSLKSIRCSASK